MKINLPLRIAFPVALAICIAYIFWFKNHNKPLTSNDIVRFEIAGTPAKAQVLLDEWVGLGLTDKLLSSIYWDYPFILLYTLTLALGCLWAAGLTGYPTFKRTASWLVGGVCLAGLSDVVENLAMTYSIRQAPQAWSTRLAETTAYLKFGLLVAGLLFVAICFVVALLHRAKAKRS